MWTTTPLTAATPAVSPFQFIAACRAFHLLLKNSRQILTPTCFPFEHMSVSRANVWTTDILYRHSWQLTSSKFFKHRFLGLHIIKKAALDSCMVSPARRPTGVDRNYARNKILLLQISKFTRDHCLRRECPTYPLLQLSPDIPDLIPYGFHNTLWLKRVDVFIKVVNWIRSQVTRSLCRRDSSAFRLCSRGLFPTNWPCHRPSNNTE